MVPFFLKGLNGGWCRREVLGLRDIARDENENAKKKTVGDVTLIRFLGTLDETLSTFKG